MNLLVLQLLLRTVDLKIDLRDDELNKTASRKHLFLETVDVSNHP
jgi:hypothetical protein